LEKLEVEMNHVMVVLPKEYIKIMKALAKRAMKGDKENLGSLQR
jgi:hypothetical protein